MRVLVRFIILFLLGAIALQFPLSSHPESTPASSQSSHSLAITGDGQLLCVVNPDSNSISLVSTGTLTTLAEITVGRGPRKVALAGDLAYVTNNDSDSLSVVSLLTRSQVAELPVGDRPIGIAVSPDERFLAIAESGQDTIRFLDTSAWATLSVIPVPDRPFGLSFTPDGTSLLVSHLLDGAVTRLPVRPYTSFLPAIAKNAGSASPDPDPHRNVDQVDGFSLPRAGVSIPTWEKIAPAPAVIVNRSGTRAYLPGTMGNGIGLNTQFDSTVFPKVSVLDLEANTHLVVEHISLPELDGPVGLPWDAALSNDERELWVVNAASNDVSVINLSNPSIPTRQANIPVSHNPRGIVFSPDGKTAYVHNTLAGTISVIDAQNHSVIVEIPTTTIPLPPLLLEGKRLFHSSSRAELAQAAWISCNTCHVGGEHDGRTWLVQFLGEVPPGELPVLKRNTTSLLGMVQTYPLRWSAEWDESADSEFSIRFEQFGSGLIPGEMHPTLGAPNQGRSTELDALAAFIDSLGVPERQVSLSPAEQHGRQLFESPATGCQDCHPSPLYTNLQQYDVGTGDLPGEWFGPQFDTPTLRFLFDSSPYLHDGRAATLEEVLTTANPDDLHGRTSHLSPQEIQDLVSFLLMLPYE